MITCRSSSTEVSRRRRGTPSVDGINRIKRITPQVRRLNERIYVTSWVVYATVLCTWQRVTDYAPVCHRAVLQQGLRVAPASCNCRVADHHNAPVDRSSWLDDDDAILALSRYADGNYGAL